MSYNTTATSASASEARTIALAVRGDNLLNGVRAYLATLATQALVSGYPGKLATINDLAREAGVVCKRSADGTCGASVGLAHAIARTLDRDVAFAAGDVLDITVVSPADLASDEYLPDIFLTTDELEAKAKADSIEARAKAEADIAAAKGAVPADAIVVKSDKSAAELAADAEAARLAERAAQGIKEADIDRPWVVTPAKWNGVRNATVSFKVPTLAEVTAFYGSK